MTAVTTMKSNAVLKTPTRGADDGARGRGICFALLTDSRRRETLKAAVAVHPWFPPPRW